MAHDMNGIIETLREINPVSFGGLERYVGGLERGLEKFKMPVTVPPITKLEDFKDVPLACIPRIEESLTGSGLVFVPTRLLGGELLPHYKEGGNYVSRGPYTNEEWQRLVVSYIPERIVMKASPETWPDHLAHYLTELQTLAASTLPIQANILGPIKGNRLMEELKTKSNDFFLQDWVLDIGVGQNPDSGTKEDLRTFYSKKMLGDETPNGVRWGKKDFYRMLYSVEERKHPQVLDICQQAYDLLQPLRVAFPGK